MMIATGNEDGQQARLWAEFQQVCDCGGRLSGTSSEARATELLAALGAAAMSVAPRMEAVPYNGWCGLSGELELPDGSIHRCHPLVRTVATPDGGLSAEVIDLGRGTPDEFEAHRDEVAGRIVLVRHELMFAAGTIHRRKKYRMALESSAVGFLIAGPVAGSLVAGSSGRGDEAGIPAAGIAPETAAALARRSGGWPRIRVAISTEEAPAVANNVIFDVPGETDEWVVLSAHIDGHDLAESAIDNGSGLAVALAVARRLCQHPRRWRRGLRLAFFNIEEWALSGSAAYLAGLGEDERRRIVLNVNLDSVAGASSLTVLTSGFVGIEPFLLRCAERVGVQLGLYRPLQTNSDHANFAQAGIPAFRLVAGFGDRTASTAVVLTEADTRDRVRLEELVQATSLTETIVALALQAESDAVTAWRTS